MFGYTHRSEIIMVVRRGLLRPLDPELDIDRQARGTLVHRYESKEKRPAAAEMPRKTRQIKAASSFAAVGSFMATF